MRPALRLAVLLLATLLAMPLGAQQPPAAPDPAAEEPEVTAPPPPCGTQAITIARMQWPSAELLAAIHERLLTTGFACEVRLLPSDMASAASSMSATGQPAVAPEMWTTRIADIWNLAIKTQKLRQAGIAFAEQDFEGWFIPDYVAAANPALTTVAALREALPALAAPGTRPRFISCPADWGCAVLNRNLLRAHGLDTAFDIVEPANRFEFDSLIAAAVSRKEPVVFYYWQPNAVLAQFAFRSLDLGPFDRDAFACLGRRACPDPRPTAFSPDPVIIAVAEWVFTDAPQIAGYFQRARMPLSEMNALLAALSEPGQTVETVADRFVATREEIWRPWVGAPPAALR